MALRKCTDAKVCGFLDIPSSVGWGWEEKKKKKKEEESGRTGEGRWKMEDVMWETANAKSSDHHPPPRTSSIGIFRSSIP